MIHVVATAKLKTGRRAEFLDIFRANVPAVRNEAGCIEYYPAVDIDANLPIQQMSDDEVVVIEKWESMEALHAHLQAPHMMVYKEKVKDMVASVSRRVLQ
jgi:quinol monooxygenase YgiN